MTKPQCTELPNQLGLCYALHTFEEDAICVRHMLKIVRLGDSSFQLLALDSLDRIMAIFGSMHCDWSATIIPLAGIAIHGMQRGEAELAAV